MSPPDRDLLRRIADSARGRVAALKTATPGYRLRERLGVARPVGRLERALRRGGADGPLRLLCELARVAPAGGAAWADPDPVRFARLCQEGGAAALALVTEPDFYRGDADWVAAARGATSLPVLLDDVVVDAWQLLDAAVRGADGVRLVAELFTDVELQVLVSEARMLGLDPLVEVRDRAALARALKAGATLVGMGDDPVRHPGADPAALPDLLGAVPPLVTAVCTPSPVTRAALADLRVTRADAVLVGEALAAAPDAGAALAALAAAARG